MSKPIESASTDCPDENSAYTRLVLDCICALQVIALRGMHGPVAAEVSRPLGVICHVIAVRQDHVLHSAQSLWSVDAQ